jgi:hypothetical protein
MRMAYNILVGKPEGKRPLVKPMRRWEDNTRTDIREIGCERVDWTYLAQDWWAVMNTIMDIRVP